MKTLAAVLEKVNTPLKIEELIIPGLKRGQVLVKVAYSGICHSQLNEIKGFKGEDRFLPHVLGHEGSGVVEAVGEGVKKVGPGDTVVLTWIKADGIDVPSAAYKNLRGMTVNSGGIATFLTKTIVSENRLVKISDKMPLREAALLGCAVPTGAGIVLNVANVNKGNSVAVFGAGGVGLASIMAAGVGGANIIIAVDKFDHKLDHAKRIGATHLINSSKEDPVATIQDITKGRGADYAIESAGKKETMEAAFRSVRDSGGLCILAGNLKHKEQISIDPMELIKGKRVIGTWGGSTRPDEDIPKYMDWHMSGKINTSELITHEYDLNGINEAFKDLEHGKTGRSLIRM